MHDRPTHGREPMNLLVISMLYEPDVVGIAAIATDMCAALAERGHQVTVYTAYPYYPEWRIKSGANPWRIQEEVLAGVRVRRHGLYIPSRPSRLLPRLLHELSFPLSLMRSLMDRRRFDAVMVYCPLLGSVAFAALRKILCREPLWVNIQDIPTEAGRNVGINRSRLFHAAASVVQSVLFRSGDVWSTISPEMVSQLAPLRAEGMNVELFPNWLIGGLARQIQQLPSKLGHRPGSPLQLLYCGTIGKKQGLLDFCQAISACDLDFRFRIRGDGGEARSVRSWVERSRDSRFDFAGLLPEVDFVRSLHETDFFVITEKPGAGFSFLPSKLIPCLSTGTPVLAVADPSGPLGREVQGNDVGILLEWAQLSQLPDRLAAFQRAPQAYWPLQENSYRRAADFDRETAIGRLEDRLREVVALRGKNRPYAVPDVGPASHAVPLQPATNSGDLAGESISRARRCGL